ncbi:GNAT family N-acetyltransferase [Mesobacillus persicus]|nr:GNAT family N-acetyltransferase [Mesobacillus persicus]
MIVREITPSDSEKFSRLVQQVEGSADFMLWEAGERSIQPEQQRKMIEDLLLKENSTILVAIDDQKNLVGYLMVFAGNARRNRHSAYLVVGILKEHRGHGVGTQLFRCLDHWAVEHGIHRLELTVVTENKGGIGLYQKMGFEIEGIKRKSLIIDGEFYDEYYMGKLL